MKRRERKKIQYDLFSSFLSELGKVKESSEDFIEKLFHSLADYLTVYFDKRMVFVFCNGMEVDTEILM